MHWAQVISAASWKTVALLVTMNAVMPAIPDFWTQRVFEYKNFDPELAFVEAAQLILASDSSIKQNEERLRHSKVMYRSKLKGESAWQSSPWHGSWQHALGPQVGKRVNFDWAGRVEKLEKCNKHCTFWPMMSHEVAELCKQHGEEYVDYDFKGEDYAGREVVMKEIEIVIAQRSYYP